MAPQHGGKASAAAEGRLHIVGAPHANHFRAHQAREAGHGCHPHGDGRIDGAKAQQDDDGQRQQQRGHGQKHVDEAHQRVIDAAARCTGQQADQRARHQAHGHGQESARQGVHRAMHHAGPEITPQRIRAQPVREAGLQQLLAGLADDGILMRKPARNQGPQRGRGNHQQGQGQRGRQAPEPLQIDQDGAQAFCGRCRRGRQPGRCGRGDAGCQWLGNGGRDGGVHARFSTE